MIRIIGSRGSGKTTKLLKLAKDNGYVVVEPNMRMCDYAKRMAIQKEYNIKVISAHELLIRQHGIREEKYIVDELDLFLSSLGIQGYSNSEQ